MLVARDRDVGFEIGYDRSRGGNFYSWFGGVAPDRRVLGPAERLLETQERLARERGYCRTLVKTRTRFAGRRALLARARCRIVALDMPFHEHDLDQLRIVVVESL